MQTLEVSRKTVVRDIAFMRDRLDLPIEFDAQIQAYRYTQPVNAFPTVHMTEGELLALLVAQRALEQYRGTPVTRPKYAGFLRNVAVAMGASGDARHREPLEHLAQHPNELIAGHAKWALEQLSGASPSKDTSECVHI